MPMVVLVTWRGSHADDDSPPHQAIGRRTEALCQALFDPDAVFGDREGRAVLGALRSAVARARRGDLSALLLSPRALRRTRPPELFASPSLPAPRPLEELRRSKGWDSVPPALRGTSPLDRDEALREIARAHPGAALLFCNGFTSRAAQAVVDRPGNFYNTGYMGGTMALGWGLATVRPDLQVVVVDGDQNALMSTMKDQLQVEYPANLHWYILDNGIGASVGTSESLPLPHLYHSLARVLRTVPDPPGSFKHPRVSHLGAYAASAGPDTPDNLAGLASAFRRWVAAQGENHVAPPA